MQPLFGNRFGNKRGAILLVALGIVIMFMYLAISITPIVISQMKEGQSSVMSIQAYYTAESALNEGLYVMAHMKEMEAADDLGSYVDNYDSVSGVLSGSVEFNDICTGTTEPPPCNGISEGSWRIFNSSGSEEKYDDGTYSYPVPGTGSAGTTCDPWNPVVKSESGDLGTECGKLTPGDGNQWAKLKCSLVVDGGLGSVLKKQGKKGDEGDIGSLLNKYTDPRDLPCNWNKIRYEETVEIPLYGKDGALEFTEFKLRVRTPCKEVCKDGDVNCEIPELCEDGERYVLSEEVLPTLPQEPSPVAKVINKSKTAIKDTLILWSVEEGECDGFCFLSNMVNVVSSDPSYVIQKASLITANHIQNPTPDPLDPDLKYLILDKYSTGLKDANPEQSSHMTILDLGKNPFLSTSLSDSSYFKLHYAKQGTYLEGTEKNIPYLEYQLLYNANEKSLLSSDPLVVAEGYMGGFKKTLQARYNPKTGAINYVVQQ